LQSYSWLERDAEREEVQREATVEPTSAVALAVSVQAGQHHRIHVPGAAAGGAVLVGLMPARICRPVTAAAPGRLGVNGPSP
jgi:hypothetical protein